LGDAQARRQISRRKTPRTNRKTPRNDCGAREHDRAAQPHDGARGPKAEGDLRRERHRL